MAQRGTKPQPAHLRLVKGTHRSHRHGSREVAAARAAVDPELFGPISKPGFLKGEALKAWKRYVEPCYWLDASSEPSAILFCELWQEFRDSPRGFAANKYAQMRHLMQELGLTDERNRGDPAKAPGKDEFFND